MKLPPKLFSALGSSGFDIYSQLYKGVKVAAALRADSSTQMDLGPSYQNTAERKETSEIRVFNFRTKCTLRLKNISGYPAHAIKILNGAGIFSTIHEPKDAFSLAPGEFVDIDCWFVSNQVHTTVDDKQNYDFIHPDKLGSQLIIAYQNEAGIEFYATYTLHASKRLVDYSLDNPLANE